MEIRRPVQVPDIPREVAERVPFRTRDCSVMLETVTDGDVRSSMSVLLFGLE